MPNNPELIGPLCVVLSGCLIAAIAWLFGDKASRF